MGKFVTKTGKDGKFYFSLKADNGQVILSSEGYNSTSGRETGIQSVKTNAPIDARYAKLTSSNGKPYFTLKAANGEVIGKSEMYESNSGMENGIASVKANAPTAGIVAEWLPVKNQAPSIRPYRALKNYVLVMDFMIN